MTVRDCVLISSRFQGRVLHSGKSPLHIGAILHNHATSAIFVAIQVSPHDYGDGDGDGDGVGNDARRTAFNE